jgi:hypothetical protein
MEALNRTERRVRNPRASGEGLVSVLAALTLVTAVSGCCTSRYFTWMPGCGQPPCVLAPDATQQEVVEHLNRNISRLYCWRSTDVSIRARGVPVSLSAHLAVESPRKFRLMARSMRGDEADLGSNSERFWFWMREGGKHVYTASHEDIDRAQDLMQLPFEPDWLMEALGVIPIDETKVRMERPTPDVQQVQLVSQHRTSGGLDVTKVIVVDTCRGWITQQVLYGPRGRVIARADFDRHQLDPETGITMPHRIHLEWPASETTLTLNVGDIEINPHEMPEETWQMQEKHGYPVLDLGQLHRGGVRPAANAQRW